MIFPPKLILGDGVPSFCRRLRFLGAGSEYRTERINSGLSRSILAKQSQSKHRAPYYGQRSHFDFHSCSVTASLTFFLRDDVGDEVKVVPTWFEGDFRAMLVADGVLTISFHRCQNIQ
jgi:hypothetical protein